MAVLKAALAEKYPLNQYILILVFVASLSLVIIIIWEFLWFIIISISLIIAAIYLYLNKRERVDLSSQAVRIIEDLMNKIRVEDKKIILPFETRVKVGHIHIAHLTRVFGGHEYIAEFHPIDEITTDRLDMNKTWLLIVDQNGTVYIKLPAYQIYVNGIPIIISYALPLILERKSGSLEVVHGNEKAILSWELEGTDLEGSLVYIAGQPRKAKGAKAELRIEYPYGIFRIRLADATIPNYDYTFSERIIIPFDTARIFLIYPDSLFYSNKVFSELLRLLDAYKILQQTIIGDLSEVKTVIRVYLDIPVKPDIAKEEIIEIKALPRDEHSLATSE